ncbi:hypothetical protein ACFQZZ_01570 [Nocardia sp. GCM10030253]|uniref:hypothetical protein n=1 Tax=Nocardia sp. GCM10030253 TaxID=3273404 RepID=UPI00363D517A
MSRARSSDLLTFVEKLTRATGVRIDEDNYPHSTSIRFCGGAAAFGGFAGLYSQAMPSLSRSSFEL